MARTDTVFVHIGLPKTGTTYLQRVLAANRAPLRSQGVAYLGTTVDHFFAAQDLLGKPFRGHPDSRVTGAWKRLVGDARSWRGPAVISHELLATATADDVRRLVDDLSPRPVRVVVTLRDLPRQLVAVWQEDVKNGRTETFPDFLDRVRSTSQDPQRRGRRFWRFQDVPGILSTWSDVVGASSTAVVTVPLPDSAHDSLWSRFARAIAVDPQRVDPTVPRRNVSLGAGEAEFLRRLNEWAADAMEWPSYRRLVKKQMGEGDLAARTDTPRISLPSDVGAWAATESARMADQVAAAGYPVVGELDDLRPPPAADGAPWPPQEAAVLEAALASVQGLLTRAAASSQDRP